MGLYWRKRMKINEEELKTLSDGTILTIFLQGDDWEEEIGETYSVIKVNDKLYVLDKETGFFNLNEINETGFEYSLSLDKTQNFLLHGRLLNDE